MNKAIVKEIRAIYQLKQASNMFRKVGVFSIDTCPLRHLSSLHDETCRLGLGKKNDLGYCSYLMLSEGSRIHIGKHQWHHEEYRLMIYVISY